MFSVVIPVYNKRPTLARAVASVLSQRYDRFELIVVDDGSTDGSLSELAIIDDPRLRILSQPNAGPGAARNTGVDACRGEWVAFLDADDFWMDDHLDELDRIRRAYPGAALIGTAFLNAQAGAIPNRLPAREGNIALIRYFDAVGNGDNVFCASTAAVKKMAWASVGGFGDYPSGEDMEFWARLALRWPVASSTKVTAIYVHGTGGISDQQKTRWLGKPLRELKDVSPAVARLLAEKEAYPHELNGSLTRYISRYLYWCLHGSARIGDIQTLRALRRLYLPSGLSDRTLLYCAQLPSALAKASHKAIFGLHYIARRVRRALGFVQNI